jgi:hypothetical protein
VACASRVRCYVVTDGPRAWLTDGDSYQPTRLGEPEARAAGAGDRRAGDDVRDRARRRRGGPDHHAARGRRARARGERLAAAAQDRARAAAQDDADGVVRGGVGANTLWLGLRVTGADGATAATARSRSSSATATPCSTGRGAPARRCPPRRCRCASSLTGILFDSGATYYASLAGVSRWQEGQLRTWNENDGLASELVHAIARGSDGAIWAATSEGLARFDGQNWRPLGTTALVTRGLAHDGKGASGSRTGKGLRGCRRRQRRPPPIPAPRRRPGGRHARRRDRSVRQNLGDVDHFHRSGRAEVTTEKVTIGEGEGPFLGRRDTVSRRDDE